MTDKNQLSSLTFREKGVLEIASVGGMRLPSWGLPSLLYKYYSALVSWSSNNWGYNCDLKLWPPRACPLALTSLPPPNPKILRGAGFPNQNDCFTTKQWSPDFSPLRISRALIISIISFNDPPLLLSFQTTHILIPWGGGRPPSSWQLSLWPRSQGRSSDGQLRASRKDVWRMRPR